MLWSPILIFIFDGYLKVRGEAEAGHDIEFYALAFLRIALEFTKPDSEFFRLIDAELDDYQPKRLKSTHHMQRIVKEITKDVDPYLQACITINNLVQNEGLSTRGNLGVDGVVTALRACPAIGGYVAPHFAHLLIRLHDKQLIGAPLQMPTPLSPRFCIRTANLYLSAHLIIIDGIDANYLHCMSNKLDRRPPTIIPD